MCVILTLKSEWFPRDVNEFARKYIYKCDVIASFVIKTVSVSSLKLFLSGHGPIRTRGIWSLSTTNEKSWEYEKSWALELGYFYGINVGHV